jgi:CheY-like chemotaxis protein
MFEEFSQESNSITPQYQGTGLGLPIVKRLTDLMGARLTVKSRQGEGTEFRIHFRLPIVGETGDSREKQALGRKESLRGKRVLLAEDHPLNLVIAQKLLEKAGMIVVSAENGQTALEKFRSMEPRYFDGILMDIRMPVLNGLEAARAIRALDRPDARTVPIIAMTANAFDADMEESRRAGMNAHLSKPIDPQALYATLARLLS